MFRPSYFRPYGAQDFTRAVSASARISVPRFWRIYLALWLISRWRLPATPCLILPVAVSLKRFLTPLLVLSLGIFVSLWRPEGRDVIQPPRHAFRPGHWFFQRSGKRGPIVGPRDSGKLAHSPLARSPRIGLAVMVEKAAGLLRAQLLDRPAHVGNAVVRGEARAR